MDKYVSASTNHPLVVHGSAGLGKSALLANWVVRFIHHHPEDIVVSHYVGCSSASTDYASLINRVMTEIQTAIGAKNMQGLTVPKGAAQLVQDFGLWLMKATQISGRRLVLLIDGLDRLEDYDNALDLLWLPRDFPENVRIILSCLSPSRPFDALKKRAHQLLDLTPLPEWERVQFVRTYLDWHSKKLDESQEFKIAAAEQVSNPRFGKVLLDDIAVLGEYEKLNEQIHSNLTCQTTMDLYQKVIQRLHDDYDKGNTGVVEAFMSLLWSSRRGLTEVEIEVLMTEMGHSRQAWNPLFLAMEDMLFQSGDSGLLNFSDTDFKLAVEKEFMTTQQKIVFSHEAIANYFVVQPEYGDRKVEELPWQIAQLKSPSRLCECLSDLELFQSLYKHQELKFYLIRWWRDLEKSGFDVVQSYNTVLDFYEKDRYFLAGKDAISTLPFLAVGNFLEDAAKLEGAEKVYNRALGHAHKATEKADIMLNLARLFETQARFDLAEEVLRTAQQENATMYGPDSIQSSNILTRLGVVLIHTGKLIEAEDLLKKSLAIRQKILGNAHSRCGQTLKHLLVVSMARGDYVAAENFGLAALKVTEESCGPYDFHVSSILLKIGELYNQLQRHTEAEAAFDRALKIRTTKFGEDHPFTADVMREIAVAYEQQGKWREAEQKYLTSLKIKTASLGEMHPDIAQLKNRLAAVYIGQKMHSKAEPLLVDALHIRQVRLGPHHSRVAQTLKHMLTLYEETGNYAKAIDCGEQALELTKLAFGDDHFHVSSIYFRIAVLETALDAFEKAHSSFDKALQIRITKFGSDHNYVADILHPQGVAYKKQGDLTKAVSCWRKALAIRQKTTGMEHHLTKQTRDELRAAGELV